jgi:hypothetical protein
MLRVLGSAKRLCDGLTRREMLLAGGLGLFGLQSADLFRLQALGAAPTPTLPHPWGEGREGGWR